MKSKSTSFVTIIFGLLGISMMYMYIDIAQFKYTEDFKTYD